MAVARKAPLCPKCGKPYKAMHRKTPNVFVGDSFMGWNIDGHVCNEKPAPTVDGAKVIDISANEPHKSSELICVRCCKRWFGVRHADVFLKEIECPYCKILGGVIETGEDMRVRDNIKPAS